ncbi:OsmC family protein [Amycolatopsis anabasis]|uniref:OsmC family protein n=1 Tax=Amycolatopsis anabasis TaxID=1840409 RepID=UPI00131AD68E|nr:OsmC family protein [Amycolatopsis anabasis]
MNHEYRLTVEWRGNRGPGTTGVRDFDRAHEIRADGKPPIPASSDPALRGDATRWNPEELLVAALSECHMLWYLHLAALAGVVVTAYTDNPLGTMAMDSAGGSGRFTRVVLRPVVTLADPAMAAKAGELHEKASAKCFIARSVNFPVEHEPEFRSPAKSI